jgi:TRAP-type C4-dicarboxylate transport system permease large subunit
MSSVTGEKIERISVSLIPFLIVEVFILFLVAFWDKMTLFIPRLIM